MEIRHQLSDSVVYRRVSPTELLRKVMIPDGTDVWAMVLAERELERRLRRTLSSPRR